MQIIKYLVVMWDPKIKEDMPCSLESYFVTKCHKEHSIFQNQCFYKQFHNCKLKMENVIMHCEHCFFYIQLVQFLLSAVDYGTDSQIKEKELKKFILTMGNNIGKFFKKLSDYFLPKIQSQN